MFYTYKILTFTILLTIWILFDSVSAQSCATGDVNGYNTCISSNDDYERTTCNPLQNRNMTWYQQCICYASHLRMTCYDRCVGDTVSSELKIIAQNRKLQNCQAGGLSDPLPNIPPWQNSNGAADGTTTTNNGGNFQDPSNTTPQGGASSTFNPTPGPKVNSNSSAESLFHSSPYTFVFSTGSLIIITATLSSLILF